METESTPYEELVLKAVKLMHEHSDLDDEALAGELTKAGLDPLSARKMVTFVPSAFAMVELAPLGIHFTDSFSLPQDGGSRN